MGTKKKSTLLAQLEWECCPCLKQGLPSEAEMQSIFPKGRRMDVMVYVNMIKKPPVRMHKGQKISSFFQTLFYLGYIVISLRCSTERTLSGRLVSRAAWQFLSFHRFVPE